MDCVIANSGIAELGPPFKGRLVEQDGRDVEHARIVTADLIDATFPVRHDSGKLADCILGVYHRGVPEAETKARAGA